MTVRKTAQAGHPALKTKNKKVTAINTPEIRKLIKDLVDTMYRNGLIGIAAPQIGENYMIFVTHPRRTKSRKLGKADKLRVYINPKIMYTSKEKSLIYEGCESVVGGDLFGPVVRPKEVTVLAYDQKGNKFTLTCDGLLARVIQHEMDHLLQTEFIQKVNDYGKLLLGEYYRKEIRKSKSQLEESKITKIEYKKI